MPELHVRGFRRRRDRTCRGENLAALVLHFLDLFFDGGDDVIQFLDILEEIGDVQEGVAIEADIDEGDCMPGSTRVTRPL